MSRMAMLAKTQYTAAMPPETVVVVSDVHLGHAPEPVASAFHRFLDVVPDLGSHLVVNGDLFDFWFEYGAVIPRHAFPTLSALDRVRRRGVRITVTGGNHDRWGGEFWRQQLGAEFHRAGVTVPLAGWRTFLAHGDGLAERHLMARAMHRVTRWPVTAALFRWLHPDLGFRLVDLMSRTLADQTRDPAALDRAAASQEDFARAYLEAHADVDLVVLGHTHRPALVQVGSGGGRWYVNPGAWMEGGRYALITSAGPTLETFAGAASRADDSQP